MYKLITKEQNTFSSESEFLNLQSPTYSRGSEWRKWDLHFHTPSSYDYKNKGISNEDIIKRLIEEKIAVVAITDHETMDIERIKELKKIAGDKITILPGIELKAGIEGGKDPIHFIGIFSEDADLNYIWTKLQAYCELTEKDIETKKCVSNIYCDLKETCQHIHELGGIVSVHMGSKSNSFDKNITNSLPYKLAAKIDFALGNIDIFELGKEQDQKGYIEKVFPSIGKTIPMIICSDNHNVENYTVKENLWIKADPTFKGLKQIINEPDRVCIDKIPPKKQWVLDNSTNVLSKIHIQKTNESTIEEKWFGDSIDLPLNQDMVAIIGNQGSGKSALVDIIALVCNAKIDKKHFSFLNEDKFCNKKNNIASKFEACATWVSGETPDDKKLDDAIEDTELPRVKYIPQSYLDKICTDVESNLFDEDLKKVIFSHISDTNKLGKNTFSELIEFKTNTIKNKLETSRDKLKKLNDEIVKLEERQVPDYLKKIEVALDGKKNELKAHINNKPKEVPNPKNSNNIEEMSPDNELYKIQKIIDQSEETLSKQKGELKDLAVNIQITGKLIDRSSPHISGQKKGFNMRDLRCVFVV